MKAKTALKWTIGVIAVVILMAVGAVVLLFVAFIVSMERGEKHQRQIRAEQDSGRWDFGDQPALFAVAQGIVKNDPDAIRAAAKSVPDLQAPGRYGAILLILHRVAWRKRFSAGGSPPIPQPSSPA